MSRQVLMLALLGLLVQEARAQKMPSQIIQGMGSRPESPAPSASARMSESLKRSMRSNPYERARIAARDAEPRNSAVEAAALARAVEARVDQARRQIGQDENPADLRRLAAAESALRSAQEQARSGNVDASVHALNEAAYFANQVLLGPR